MAQVRKEQLSKRHSIATPTTTKESEDDMTGEDTSSNRRQRKKPVAKNTVSLAQAANSSKRQRSISLIHNKRKVSAEAHLARLRQDTETRKEVDRKLSEIDM